MDAAPMATAHKTMPALSTGGPAANENNDSLRNRRLTDEGGVPARDLLAVPSKSARSSSLSSRDTDRQSEFTEFSSAAPSIDNSTITILSDSRSVARAKRWSELTEDCKTSVVQLATDLYNSGLIVDRKHRLITQPKVFVGSEAIDWLVHTKRAQSREEGKDMLQLLVVAGFIHHVGDDRDMEDRHLFYRFRRDDKDKDRSGPSVMDLLSAAICEGWLGIRKGKSSLRSKKQYCVLAKPDGHWVLYIFQTDVATSPKYFINFEKTHFTVRHHSNSETKHAFQLHADAPDGAKVRLLATAKTAEHIESWVQALVEAGAEYVEPERLATREATSIYDFTAFDLDHRPISFDCFRGRVVLIVNTASKCPQAPKHFAQLQRLHELYHSKGLDIVAFPCNQFGSGEYDDPDAIRAMAREHGVAFRLMERVDVNGTNTTPLFAYLKAHLRGQYGMFIKWNFTRFLVARNGQPYMRFGSRDTFETLESEVQRLIIRQPADGLPQPVAARHSDAATSPLQRASAQLSPQDQASVKRRSFPLSQQDIAAVFPEPPSPGSARQVHASRQAASLLVGDTACSPFPSIFVSSSTDELSDTTTAPQAGLHLFNGLGGHGPPSGNAALRSMAARGGDNRHAMHLQNGYPEAAFPTPPPHLFRSAGRSQSHEMLAASGEGAGGRADGLLGTASPLALSLSAPIPGPDAAAQMLPTASNLASAQRTFGSPAVKGWRSDAGSGTRSAPQSLPASSTVSPAGTPAASPVASPASSPARGPYPPQPRSPASPSATGVQLRSPGKSATSSPLDLSKRHSSPVILGQRLSGVGVPSTSYFFSPSSTPTASSGLRSVAGQSSQPPSHASPRPVQQGFGPGSSLSLPGRLGLAGSPGGASLSGLLPSQMTPPRSAAAYNDQDEVADDLGLSEMDCTPRAPAVSPDKHPSAAKAAASAAAARSQHKVLATKLFGSLEDLRVDQARVDSPGAGCTQSLPANASLARSMGAPMGGGSVQRSQSQQQPSAAAAAARKAAPMSPLRSVASWAESTISAQRPGMAAQPHGATAAPLQPMLYPRPPLPTAGSPAIRQGAPSHGAGTFPQAAHGAMAGRLAEQSKVNSMPALTMREQLRQAARAAASRRASSQPTLNLSMLNQSYATNAANTTGGSLGGGNISTSNMMNASVAAAHQPPQPWQHASFGERSGHQHYHAHAPRAAAGASQSFVAPRRDPNTSMAKGSHAAAVGNYSLSAPRTRLHRPTRSFLCSGNSLQSTFV